MHPQPAVAITSEGSRPPAKKRFLPQSRIAACATYRDAVRLAWDHRAVPGMTQRTLAELADLYAPHVSSYLHECALDRKGKPRLDLPADRISAFERVVGNNIVTQYLAFLGALTLMEEFLESRAQ